jgi:hypothetical protein
MSQTDPCAGCGLPVGREACRELFNDVALRVRALAWTGSLKTWRLMHDAYNVQHEAEFCGRYTALVTHLGGVCWAIEHGGNEPGYRALQALVDQNPWKKLPYPPPPGIPDVRGSLTIGNLRDLQDPESLNSGVDRWARSVWLAYAPMHAVAREWVQQALLLKPGRSSPRA